MFGVLGRAGALAAFAFTGVVVQDVSVHAADPFASGIVIRPSAAVAADGAWVDTTDRSAVRRLYDAEWRRPDPEIGWTGSTAACDPGSVSAELVTRTLDRVNAYRSLAGVSANVVEDPTHSSASQAAAMLMLANNALSHTPPTTWTCYSPLAASGAGSSNLYLGVSGVRAIDGYMIDPGPNNTRVGHRRSILLPRAQRMGVGSTTGSQALGFVTTNLGVNTTRDTRGFITWPSAGTFPAPLLVWVRAPLQRWSVMNSTVDLSLATITITGPNGNIPFSIDHQSANLLVFVPHDPVAYARRQLTATGTTPIAVNVVTPSTSYSYTVDLLDVEIGRLTARTPTRIVDTRVDLGVADVSVNSATRIDVRRLAGLPQAATAIVANVTVVDPQAAGFLSVTDCSGPQHAWSVQTSSLNFAKGETRANLVALPLSPDGYVCVVSTTKADVLVDLAGHYAFDGEGYTPFTPERIVDTRVSGTPLAGRGAPMVVQVAGHRGVPVGASSVTMNLTATGTTAPGYLTAWPCDAPRPEVSNVNYLANQSVPNLATVRLDPSGQVCIYADATTHVLVDVSGYTLAN